MPTELNQKIYVIQGRRYLLANGERFPFYPLSLLWDIETSNQKNTEPWTEPEFCSYPDCHSLSIIKMIDWVKYYCQDHINICGDSYCDNPIFEEQDYCINHLAQCQNSRQCYQRINEEEKYCSQHQDICQDIRCSAFPFLKTNKRMVGQNFCSRHLNTCRANNCDWRTSCSNQYCSKHVNLCQEVNCQERIPEITNYCYHHRSHCYDCQKRIEGNNKYCLEHTKTCQINSCEEKLLEGGDYCLFHWENCQVNGCFQRLKKGKYYCSSHETISSEDYFYQHQKECVQENCKEKNLFTKNYCYFHSPNCYYKDEDDWECTIKVDKERNYCQKYARSCLVCSNRCKNEYCWKQKKCCDETNCANRISKYQTYCYQHTNKCANCSTRVSRNQTYCEQHMNQCSDSYCSIRIARSTTYCLNHNNVCSQPVCYQRISTNQVYCSNHTSYCSAASCYQRISSYQIYCASCHQQHQEQMQLKSLVRQKTSLTNPQEVVRFNTWWNNNLATVVAYCDGYYRAFLLVYVKENDTVKVFPSDISSNWWGEHSRKQHTYLSDAKSEATWLRGQLASSYGKYHDHPVLLIHPYSDCSRSFATFVCDPYVMKEQLGSENKDVDILFFVRYSSSRPIDLNNSFKPLDIVWVKKYNNLIGKRYYHVGIYLGKNAILHYSDPDSLVSNKNMKARITDWDIFLKGGAGKIVRHQSIIPFKYYKKSIDQAVKAWWADYGKGKYSLTNNNCEHLANSLVYGINYSLQVEDRKGELSDLPQAATATWLGMNIGGSIASLALAPFTGGTSLLFLPGALMGAVGSAAVFADHKINNGKGREINLRDEINSWDSNGKFDNLTSYRSDRIKEYEYEYEIQIPPKQECMVM